MSVLKLKSNSLYKFLLTFESNHYNKSKPKTQLFNPYLIYSNPTDYHFTNRHNIVNLYIDRAKKKMSLNRENTVERRYKKVKWPCIGHLRFVYSF